MSGQSIIKSKAILENNIRYIPGGISSINRVVMPETAFVRGEGAYMWDADGNKYIDYHAGFGPYFLGHNFPAVTESVEKSLHSGESLFGAGPSGLEGELAEIICKNLDPVEKLTFLNTGSEATSLSIRLSRAITGRNHFIVMQGGYNGNHDELACNVFNTLEEIGPRVSPGEYPIRPTGAGTVSNVTRFVHVINFNDIESVRYICKRYPVAALITEPVLQNIGIVKPRQGYLEELRQVADEEGFLLIFDEVKTGFRHALGGYAEISGVNPDLMVYGKAIANGFPLAALGGRAKYMDYIFHSDKARRPFVAGTYNGHPVNVAAGLETVKFLADKENDVYKYTYDLGERLEQGMASIFESCGIEAVVARQGSALSYYFMPERPNDWHDIMDNHDFDLDVKIRTQMVEEGIYFMPQATKQCSVSYSHTAEDIDYTLDKFEKIIRSL